jgi:hypothetical protein
MLRPISARFAAVALLLAAAPASAQLPDAQAVLDRYKAATGTSENAYEGISSIRTNINMAMPAQGMSVTVQVDALLPDKFVTRMDIPGMGQVSTGYDGAVGWSINPMQGARVLDGDELDAVRNQAKSLRSPGVANDIADAETTGEDTVDGKKCWLVKMTSDEGVVSEGCFDAETGFLLQQKTSQGGMEVETLFEDYRKFGPVTSATRIVARAQGQEQIITVESVEYDAVDPAAMKLPPEIEAIVKG